MSIVASEVAVAQPPDARTIALLSNSLRQANSRIRALEQQLAWEDELFANPHLSPGHKLTLRQAVYTVRKAPRQDSATKIYIPAIAEKVGLSSKTVGKNLQFLADTGALIREEDTTTDGLGQRITRIYIGLTEQVNHPGQIAPPTPRNHGGLRLVCPHCGSDQLQKRTIVTCKHCGEVLADQITDVNPEQPPDSQLDYRSSEPATTPPTDNLTGFNNQKEPTDNLTAGSEKPATPPGASVAIIPAMSQELAPGAISYELPAEQDAERDRQFAALLLLDIAGDSQEHIAMNANPDNPKKYVTIHRPLTLADMRQHLAGRRTLGAGLQYQDGTTRALCFDADELQTWQELQASAGVLIAAGYRPLLEPSPADRGGHLWLIFSERVNAAAARQQVITIATGLEQIVEYWPGRGNQKVRLPAGRYVTPTFAQWTTLIDGSRQENVKSGSNELNRFSILLSNLTPAMLIPDVAPAAPAPARTAQAERSAPQPWSASEPDERHRRKYGHHAMWVQWLSEQYLIDLYNATHTIAELATFEPGGMINAAAIGRPERTASVAVTPDGQRFTDFGAGAQQLDGRPDGGDPFEFFTRSQQKDKAEVLRDLGRDLNRAASREILRAARAGEPLPLWVLEIITPAGRAVYNENAHAHGHAPLPEPPQAEQAAQPATYQETIQQNAGCVALSGTGELWQPGQKTMQQPPPQEYEGDYPPPQRPCMCCNVVAWQWAGDRYVCANPGHPLEEP